VHETESVGDTVELTTPYFSSSFQCKVSDMRCLTVQNARMSLQLTYCSPNRTVCAKFINSLNTESHYHRVRQLEVWEISRDAAVSPAGCRLHAAYHWFNLRGCCHRAYKLRASISNNEMWSGLMV